MHARGKRVAELVKNLKQANQDIIGCFQGTVNCHKELLEHSETGYGTQEVSFVITMLDNNKKSLRQYQFDFPGAKIQKLVHAQSTEVFDVIGERLSHMTDLADALDSHLSASRIGKGIEMAELDNIANEVSGAGSYIPKMAEDIDALSKLLDDHLKSSTINGGYSLNPVLPEISTNY